MHKSRDANSRVLRLGRIIELGKFLKRGWGTVNSDEYLSPWTQILANSQELLQSYQGIDGERVLFAINIGGHPVATVMGSLVAVAVLLRRGSPYFLLCDRLLPACEMAMLSGFPELAEFLQNGPRHHLCSGCFQSGTAVLRPLPIPLHSFSQFITHAEIQEAFKAARNLSVMECFAFVDDGVALGEEVRAAVTRFFASTSFEDQEDPTVVRAVAHRYMASAFVALAVAKRVLERVEPACVVIHHGVYVPQGVMAKVARRHGIRVVAWGPSYRNTTVYFSHGDTYHRTFPCEPTSNWEHMFWSAERQKTIEEYLTARRKGQGDWSWITPAAGKLEDQHRLLSELGLDESKPIVGLLTNIAWDADIFYTARAFDSMLDWLFTTLDFFARHSEMQLIVRAHPHEVKAGNRQLVAEEIRKRGPELPDNIKIVPYDSEYSTYALMDMCCAVLVYGTKTAIELAPYGIPVIVAADAWTRNKRITYDVSSQQEYFDFLVRLPTLERLSPEIIDRAKKYAYHYFFRRMIPLASLDPNGGYPPVLRIKTLADLLSGSDRGLDVICEGILTGKEFIYEPAP